MALQAVDTCIWHCTCSCFSLTVDGVFTLNPMDVGCVLIDILVLDA